jgi:predicted acyl esterase
MILVNFIVLFFLVNAQDTSILSQLKEGFQLVDITAHDGITLKSIYFNPSPTQAGSKNPTVIFISSWGMNKWEYVIPANEYAEKGYTVVSYTARGFWESGGVIDMAGANDMADVSTAIDWAIANTNADPSRIGLSGISYGGGISILASSKDTRVKSVAAMSCWVNLAESFLGNGETIRTEAARFLQILADITGKPSEDLQTLFDDYFHNKNLDFLYDFTYNSSAVHFIDDINKNKPAMFIANALGDSLFTPNQFPDFFNQLTMPKHIEFAPGDHAGPELPGLLGLPNQVWTRAVEWNDYYLASNHNDVYADMPLVVFNTMNGDEIETYDSWESITTKSLTFGLAKNENLNALNSVKDLNSTFGSVLASITTGANANINGGVAYISSTVRAYIDVQRRFEMHHIDRKRGAVFVSSSLDSDYNFRGIPTFDLKFKPTASSGTFVVYILDVDHLNIGHLFTFSPWTFKDVVPGEVITLPIEITLTSYDIPKGHKLAVVVGTHDVLYLDQSPNGMNIDIMDGSSLTMPINA